jgi:hypothetical protein
MTDRASTIQDRFERFHLANPHVYEGLVRLARQLKARGHGKTGIDLLFCVLRWEEMMTTSGESGYRLNDHMRSRYARLIMEREPDLDGFFDVRQLKAA